jgi:hypothetical protein
VTPSAHRGGRGVRSVVRFGGLYRPPEQPNTEQHASFGPGTEPNTEPNAEQRTERQARPAQPAPRAERPDARQQLRDADLDRFIERLRRRLIRGASTYGDISFTRPAAEIVAEVMQDLEDARGWSLRLWLRLDPLRGAVEHTELGGTHG